MNFNDAFYLDAKANQSGISTDELKAILTSANMTAEQHYNQLGWLEGLNPSQFFDSEKYLQAKLTLMQVYEPQATMDGLKFALASNNVSPLQHYNMFAEFEGLLNYKFNPTPITVDYFYNMESTTNSQTVQENDTITFTSTTESTELTQITITGVWGAGSLADAFSSIGV